MYLNKNFSDLRSNYVFDKVERLTNEFRIKNPDKPLIKLSIGDVRRPIPKIIIDKIKESADELSDPKTFKGYGPETGYDFLKSTIIQNEYSELGISESEIFISDGSASDLANILDLFAKENTVLICDPTYPEYLDTNVMDGRKIFFTPCNSENNFVPEIPSGQEVMNLIYICNPNNPTGTTLTRENLQKFIDYAVEYNSIILYDGAYEKFITSDDVPHSIYELPGAKECAIEFRSFSKFAGFTGLRCGYTVVPKNLVHRETLINLNDLWMRRQVTKTNGVSYIVQRGAEAVFLPDAKKECAANIKYYLDNAQIIRESLQNLGYKVYGGVDSPYLWVETSNNLSSWDWFDFLLNKTGIVCVPGSGFGENGEKYFRLSSFANRDDVLDAMGRLKNV